MLAKARGENTNEIAVRHGLTPARVRQILGAGTVILNDGDTIDPVQVAFERRSQYESIFEQAAALFERIPDSNASPKVGALRLSLLALDRLTMWDQIIGVLPGQLPFVYQEIDTRKFADALLRGFEAAGTPPDAVDKVVMEITGVEIESDGSGELAPPTD